MAIFTEKSEITTLKEAGQRLAFVLDEVAKNVRVGVTELELDAKALELIEKGGDKPAFLGYTPRGSKKPYPATLCVSVNDEVVHGIPNERALRAGDIVTLDLGLVHGGIFVDMAKTYAVGDVHEQVRRLIGTTEHALREGTKVAHAGGFVGDIGAAIESRIKRDGFSVVYELGGHGVGNKLHEEPFVPNFGKRGDGERLTNGMVLALEPIVALGSGDIKLEKDGYTYKTKDGSLAAHFEDTILITEKGAEVVTRL